MPKISDSLGRTGKGALLQMAVLGVLLPLVAIGCSATATPTKTLPTTRTQPTMLVSLTGQASTGTYALSGPLDEATVAYAILHVSGPGEVTLRSCHLDITTIDTPDTSTSITESTYLATADSLQTAQGALFFGSGDLNHLNQQPQWQGMLSVWQSAASAVGAILHAGSFYILAAQISFARGTAVTLSGGDVSYSVKGGPVRTMGLTTALFQVTAN